MKATQEVSFETISSKNIFTVEQIRGGVLVRAETIENAVTLEGINSILNTYFGASAKKAAWYISLIDSIGYTAVAEADVMASHAGWAEFVTYVESARQQWTPTTATAKSLTGTAVQTFTIGTVSTGATVAGLFVTDTVTKAGTAGLLWATALFSSAAPVVTGDTFRITYTLRLSN